MCTQITIKNNKFNIDFLIMVFFILGIFVTMIPESYGRVDKEKHFGGINVSNFPVDIAINPNTNKIYVTNFLADNLTIINGQNGKIEKEIAVGDQPYGVAVNPNSNKIYVTNTESGSVSVIDGESNKVITNLRIKDIV